MPSDVAAPHTQSLCQHRRIPRCALLAASKVDELVRTSMADVAPFFLKSREHALQRAECSLPNASLVAPATARLDRSPYAGRQRSAPPRATERHHDWQHPRRGVSAHRRHPGLRRCDPERHLLRRTPAAPGILAACTPPVPPCPAVEPWSGRDHDRPIAVHPGARRDVQSRSSDVRPVAASRFRAR